MVEQMVKCCLIKVNESEVQIGKSGTSLYCLGMD